jgi:hypothetical protein
MSDVSYFTIYFCLFIFDLEFSIQTRFLFHNNNYFIPKNTIKNLKKTIRVFVVVIFKKIHTV